MSGAAEIVNTPVDMSSLKGRSVIITGGASGLGERTAIKFAANGAYVTIADVQKEAGEALAKKLVADGGHATYVHCDVCDFASSTAAFKHAVNFGPQKTLDVAVLYAGVIGNKKNLVELVEEGGEASLDSDPTAPTHAAIDINLTGLYYSTFLALHYMRLKSSGGDTSSTDKSLVICSSLAGYVDYPNNTAYGAGKFGVRGLWRSIRSKTPGIGVRTNLLAPWFVSTPMTKFMKDQLDSAGVEDGKGFTWASADYVVDAAGHCAVSKVDGRAFAVVPEGWADLNDDIEKGHGGDVLLDLIGRRMAAGDQLA